MIVNLDYVLGIIGWLVLMAMCAERYAPGAGLYAYAAAFALILHTILTIREF